MISAADLQALAEMKGPERAFLTVYLADKEAHGELSHHLKTIRSLLSEQPEELAHFEENLKLAQPLLGSFPSDAASLCIIVCWANDFARALPLPLAVETKVWVGAGPYIRPLAELHDEYEDFAVAVVDGTAAQLYRVSAAKAEAEDRVRGDVKNRVKVGGWSQKRYARRRDKEMSDYAAEVAGSLADLDAERTYSRLVLLGSDEAVQAVRESLSQSLTDKLAGTRAIDTDENETHTLDEALAVYFEGERAEERQLWERIRENLFTEGLATAGATRVLSALREARVEEILVDRDAEIEGRMCRNCELTMHGTPDTCQHCGSSDIFEVDLVETFVEQAALTSADVDFTDSFEALAEVGHVAALLRY